MSYKKAKEKSAIFVTNDNLLRRERDSNPRRISPKLISSKWLRFPYRPVSSLKLAVFGTIRKRFHLFSGNLREKCEMIARKNTAGKDKFDLRILYRQNGISGL